MKESPREEQNWLSNFALSACVCSTTVFIPDVAIELGPGLGELFSHPFE